MLIAREADAHRLRQALERSPVVLLTGPRQAGKSTLARLVVDPRPSHVFDLEEPEHAARLAEPGLALRPLAGTVVIDEAQHQSGLFPLLRVLVDEDRRPGRFLVLGSASPDLVGLGSESLAGRVALVELSGLTVVDVGVDALDSLWLRGGLPPAFLAGTPGPGGPTTSGPSSNGTWPSSECALRPRPCDGSGRWWPTTTPRPGTAPSSPRPWASRSPRSAATSTR